jgi:phage shock protein PspC (stress-responsive transcriptional regulator)
MKKLTKSKTNKWICGICAGLAEYFLADVNLIRIITILLLCVVPQAVLIAYIFAAIILPESR